MKRVWAGALGLVVGGLLVHGQARAAGGATPPSTAIAGTPPSDEIVAKQRATTRTFYGWQILATGEVGSALAAASVFLPERPLGSFPSTFGFVLGVPAYALGGPIVHWSHGDFTKGLISFGSNAAFFLGGGLIGQTVRCNQEGAASESSTCGERGFFVGAAVAMLIAPVLDAAILGWEDIPLDDVARREPRRSGWTLSPTWSMGPRGAFQMGVTGSF